MCSNSCSCCLTENGILITLNSASTHMDGKTLLEYFNLVLTPFLQDHEAPEYICLRCSKALQVSYHFIQMVKATKSSSSSTTSDPLQIEEVPKVLGNLTSPENQQQQQQTLQEVENTLTFENQFKLQIRKNNMPPKKLETSQKPNNYKILIKKSNTDAGTFVQQIKNTDFRCIICNKYFVDQKGFYEHNKQKHKEIAPFRCKMCSFYTCYAESLFKHCQKVHGLNNVQLNLYQTKQVTNAVKRNPHFEITYICIQCNFKGPTQTHIDSHLLEAHFIDEDKYLYINHFFQCPSCYRAFNDLKSAKVHYTMYHNCGYKRTNIYGNRKYACEKCGKLFDLKSGLIFHRRICETRRAVNCNFCKIKFTSVLKYEQHLQAQHLVAIKHECEICSKAFSCSEYLSVHRKRHNERYYQCDLCSKNYISNAELKVHKQRNHGFKRLNLENQVSVLSRPSEPNKRHFKCNFCDFVCYSNFSLRVHQYKHTGRPYKCQKCPKEFVSRKHLWQHCKRHHELSITNDEMAKMFQQCHGYTSRFDAFSQQNNCLEIAEINDMELEGELKEFGLTLQDIMDDLFDVNDNRK